MGFVVTPPEPVVLPVVGSDNVFPVGTVYCIGRNYAAHAREMGHDPTREPPFFFLKSTSCVTASGVMPYPRNTNDVHFEVELVAALGAGGAEIS
ncbi:MAG: fumarylacetoacetate hydrolase family protein, partial [Pseudomonadota bacterium]